MDDSLRSFHKRETALRKKHIRMARGYVTKLDKTGLIVQQADNKVGGTGARLLLRLLLLFLVFKVLLLAGLGAEAYAAHLEQLAQGAGYERAGAWLMQVDPLTSAVSDLLAPFFS